MMAFNVGGYGRSPARVFKENLEQCVVAEELGFDAIWLPEHHFSEYSLVNDPLMFAVAVAQCTKRVRIGAAVLVLPVHNPIRVAENTAFVDVLSGGRLDVGVGRGYQPAEFLGFNVPYDQTSGVYQEALDFIVRMWTEATVDFEGQYFRGEGISLEPRPVQQPHPPLWRAAVSPSTFAAAGSRGETILTSPNFTPVSMLKDNFDTYRDALRAGGWDPAAFAYPVMQQTYVGSSAQDAFDTPREHAMAYYTLLGRLLPKAHEASGSDYEFYDRVRRNVNDLEYEHLFKSGVNFGHPAAVTDRLQMLMEIVGLNYYIGWFNFGGMDHAAVLRSMERFAEQVMPNFAPEPVISPSEPVLSHSEPAR